MQIVLQVVVALLFVGSVARAEAPPPERPTLLRVDRAGKRTELPLVRAHLRGIVRGPIAQLALSQTFANPSAEPIEAIYVFPLPERAAVGGMTMRLGRRTIHAVIKTRDEARATYDKAKRDGKAAALLEQERPNVFTQSVANLLPGEQIEIELVYDVLLEPDGDGYELALPTVVGPRYHNERVPDASRVSPPVAQPGVSTGNRVGVELELDAGLPITELTSPTHAIQATLLPGGGRRIELADGAMLASKDLVLRWRVVVASPTVAALADHTGDRGHVAVIVQPPPAPAQPAATAPRELVFVVDTSGSMDGEPLALVKRAMRRALGQLGPGDAFRILNFDSQVSGFGGGAVYAATPRAIEDAKSWVNHLTSAGGTEMIHGIRAALPGPAGGGRVRHVVFMTDGYIGNETEILAAIARHLDERTHLFSFGVGSSVNRYLLDEMARVGRGVASYMLLDEDPGRQIDRFFARVAAPMMTDLAIEWHGLAVTDLAPAAIGHLFAGQPVVVAARYTRGGSGTIVVRGKRDGAPMRIAIPVTLPAQGGAGAVLGRLWARRQIAELTRPSRTRGEQVDVPAVTEIGLRYALMTAYTAFVAVEHVRRVDQPGTRVDVPVELPEGVTPKAIGGAGQGSGGGGEVIVIHDSAPVIDPTSTTQGIRINQGYVKNVPVAGRTFESTIGSAAGSQDDALGVSFAGASSMESRYYVDGINTTGLTGRRGDTFPSGPDPAHLGRWRLSADAALGVDVRRGSLVSAFTASLERRVPGSAAAFGLTGTLWGYSDVRANALATLSRWALWRLFDLRFGAGLAFKDTVVPAWQVRLAAPLPFGRVVRTELNLRLDVINLAGDDLLGATLGLGARF